MPRPTGWIRAADSPVLRQQYSDATPNGTDAAANTSVCTPRRPATTPLSTLSDAVNASQKRAQDDCAFPWQCGWDRDKYRALAHMSPVDERRRVRPVESPEEASTPPSSASTALSDTPRNAARLLRGPDSFSHVAKVWDGAVDVPLTPLRTGRRKRKHADTQQTTLEAFAVRSEPAKPLATTASLPATPPSPPSPASSVPGGSGDDELGSPARKWIRCLGSSPSEW